jgi:cyclomaltodextrinase
MNLAAIYHRCTDNYCYCLDDDNIIISIKTGYDVDKITLCYCDPFSTGIMGSNSRYNIETIEMTDVKYLEHHIFWSIKIAPKYKRLAYHFIIENENEKYHMYEDRFYTPAELKNFKGREQVFMFPWMNPSDIIRTPDWVNDTVWYQIFIDRFCNGNPDINPKNVKPWGSADKPVKYNDYYGGDIKGITSKLDYLADLGITGLYLTPICKGRSNHKYDTMSFTKIDPHFGTDEDMIELVSDAHNHGIRVMMDGVFNHTGIFFKPWQDILQNGPESKYYDWFMINSWPFKNNGRSSDSKSGNYYTFSFYDGMPKLNTNNPRVIRYIIKVLKSWILKYDIDGIRLDVAGEISHTLCKEIHRELKALKSDFYILGELWHDSMPWLRGDEYDSVMNYPFGDSIDAFWQDSKKTSTDLLYAINRCFTMYPEQVNRVLFNLLDSHDTIRLATKLNNIHIFYQQLAVLFTMPGTVCIYYGTEIAMEGSYDPDCRRCMPWNKINRGEYHDRISLMKSLIALRNDNPALRSNLYKFINIPDNPRIICYERFTEDGKNKITVVLNCSTNDYSITFPKKSVLFSINYKNELLLPNGILVYTTK